MGCNYLSLPEKPASGNKVLIWYIPEKIQWIRIIDTDTTSQEQSAAKPYLYFMGCTIWVIMNLMLTSWDVSVSQVIVASGNVSITKVREDSVYMLWVRPPSYCLHNWIGVWCIYSSDHFQATADQLWENVKYYILLFYKQNLCPRHYQLLLFALILWLNKDWIKQRLMFCDPICCAWQVSCCSSVSTCEVHALRTQLCCCMV